MGLKFQEKGSCIFFKLHRYTSTKILTGVVCVVCLLAYLTVQGVRRAFTIHIYGIRVFKNAPHRSRIKKTLYFYDTINRLRKPPEKETILSADTRLKYELSFRFLQVILMVRHQSKKQEESGI